MVSQLFYNYKVLQIFIVAKNFNQKSGAFQFRSLLLKVFNNSQQFLIINLIVIFSQAQFIRHTCLGVWQGVGKPSMSYQRVDRRGRYGNKSRQQPRTEREKRDEPIRREGLQAQGIYKQVPRPSRRLGLAPPYKLLGLAALPSLSVRLSLYSGYCLLLLPYRPLLSTLL